MKFSKLSSVMLAGLLLALPGAGCKKKPVGVTPLPGSFSGEPKGPEPAPPLGTEPKPDATSGIAQNDPSSHEGWTPNTEIFKSDTVHFALDSSTVASGEKAKVAHVADYLKSNAAEAVRVEGHCDERGTEEYNRALGDRRAQALREELVRLGIAPTRVDTISYGEDRPIDPGHDEAAWRKNRRGEFILLTPPK
jgi:peptidoglycan-associated lipoprotein